MSKSFAELGVPAAAVHALARRGVTAPFPIQSLTIADALAGRDLCGRAPTGSGKTLAFAIPVAVRAGAAAPRRPTALILVPTRELAAQVQGVLQPLAEALGRRVASLLRRHALWGATVSASTPAWTSPWRAPAGSPTSSAAALPRWPTSRSS